MTVERANGDRKEKRSISNDALQADSGFDTLTGMVHAKIRDNIIDGLHLPGERLRIERLKRDYGVSSSTLREALTMLIADRLVIAEGQRGFRVIPASAEDLIDLNRIRIVLEKEAIHQSIAHGDADWEGQVVSSFHILSQAAKALSGNIGNKELFDEWERRHRAFHMSLFAAAPSKWTRYFLTLAYQQFERYRRLFQVVAADHYKERDIEAEHTEILNAVLAKDADKAAKLLERHLMQTLDEWVEHFETLGELNAQAEELASKSTPNRKKKS